MVRSALLILLTCVTVVCAAESEGDYYRIETFAVPDDLKLEATGLAKLPDGRIAIAIRKGEVWTLENPDADPASAIFRQFASGLHEPLGLAWHDGALYLAQRTEVTKLRDTDGDGLADKYLTLAKGWGVSGAYHEYCYGPAIDPHGNFWITLNCSMGDKLNDDDAWRGWSIRIAPDGTWQPVSAGLRSPIGVGVNIAGDVFAADHQGNWVPTCSLVHLQPGVFHGHVDALKHCDLPGAPLKNPVTPGKIPSKITVAEAAQRIECFRLPAVWFPYRKMGQGATAILCDTTAGRFGPFEGQLFVGDFTLARINRVDLEKVDGEYQGACFPFRSGFQSAVVSMTFGDNGAMFVGETNRGWNSLGTRAYGLQRLTWTGKTPFEIRTMRAKPDGFELTFTLPVDRSTAADPSSYTLTSYTYDYHQRYGSDEIDPRKLAITAVQVSEDGLRARLIVEGLRAGYVHELHADGLRSADGRPLLHADAYYTLNRIPAW